MRHANHTMPLWGCNMKKNGFISVTVIYSFFLVFLSLMLYIVTNMVTNRSLLNNMKNTIKDELDNQNIARYIINHDNTLLKEENNYYFQGESPNNYIMINNHMFRIIGIFNYELKLIDNTSFSNEKYNNIENNNYATSTIFNKLNNEYITELQLNDYAKDTTWYIGGIRSIDNDVINNEIGSNKNTGAQIVSKIALPYISDYIYASKTKVISKTSNWLFTSDIWFITRNSTNFTDAYYLSSDGFVKSLNVTNEKLIKPVFYLKKTTKILSGTGTYSDPYKPGV